ncbi:MAG: carbonic anhydrase [Flavobacteriales bacterium]|nr:carbonic anhydrase [Flavobacteriales bacterium]
METNTLTQKERDGLSISDILIRLTSGNDRFIGREERISRDHRKQIEETASGQFPCAVVLSCIDSRVPVELIFDQGIGDVFSIRVAGNVLNDDVIGSMEYACKIAGVKLVVVLGHSGCGAVKGACDDVKLGKLTGLVDKIKPAVIKTIRDQEAHYPNSYGPEFLEVVAKKNVASVIKAIPEESEALNNMVSKGQVAIVGAMYYVESGIVGFSEI